MEEVEYDVVIIGGGAVAENVAERAVQGGLTAVLIEHELVGGECSFWACIPSKALLRPARSLREARAVDGAAQAVSGQVDVEAVLRRRDRLVYDWSDQSQVDWVDGAGISLIRGHGRLAGAKRVIVAAADGSETQLYARHAVVISTGSDPVVPDIPGLRASEPWTSRDATSVEHVPDSLVILGGGVVGTEMATAYAGLGCAVTLIARGDVLSGMEPFAGELVSDSLRSMGVDVHRNSGIARVSRTEEGVLVETDAGESLNADQILVATGRRPRTDAIGLETVGLEPGDWLPTDDTMRLPGFDWLYAVGDVTHRALLTHQGKYQARIAGDVIAARAEGDDVDDQPWGAHAATADREAVPQVTFTEPEVASVGLTEAAARKAGYRVSVADYDIGWVAGAVVRADGYSGRARMVVDDDRRVILGVTLVGPDVGDMLHAATTAIVGEIPIDRLWHAVPSYPTVSEIWLRLLETYRLDQRKKSQRKAE
ncbi:NAD(P)/FAD-dependent oxidoreductase [Leifsonia sp. fls2-241-R2A-40a]|uniref:dihydrolipoyl dehydrogenase family protein n=1 Tax=Leifsonia sp. fls2-241-R2A-40a TaxID=3040290 RepID=UPI00254A7E14|nr:NAD(P)/FAD-dependent oxidoreductase [Leifsonia sp. fls2-241-R2A-40a]